MSLDASHKVNWEQAGKMILSEIAIVREERQIGFREPAIALVFSDKIASALV